MDNRGMAIAEGDILVVCIRVFSELLLERYTLPEPSHSGSLLSKHYVGLLSRCSDMMAEFPEGHRDPRFGTLILPQCEPALLALGHALAYSVAVDAKVPEPLLDLFELAIVKQDPVWYAQHAGLSEEARMEKEDRAVKQALPHLKEYVDAMDVRKYVMAPIVSDSAWKEWTEQLLWHSSESLKPAASARL